MKIYSLWDAGRESAPDLVRRCFDRWEDLNPSHELVVLDRAALHAELAQLPAVVRQLPIQGASNVLRTRLLVERGGGVWTDATVLPTMPLDDWLPELVSPAGVFAFTKPVASRILSSWFLAAEPGAEIPRRLLEEICAYWDRPREICRTWPRRRPERLRQRLRDPSLHRWQRTARRDPVWTVRPDGGRDSAYSHYHWFHFLVGWLIESDAEFRAAWSRMPVRAAIAEHTVQRARFHDRLNAEEFRQAVPQLLKTGPMQKLDWRVQWPEETFAPVDPRRVAI